MKVLKNNYKDNNYINEARIERTYPREIICEKCGSELEYNYSDEKTGAFGIAFIQCPLCKHDIEVCDSDKTIELTVDNVEFPTHFSHVTEDTAVDCCERDFKKYLRNTIDYFRKNKDEYDWGGHITGNLYLHVHRFSGDECYEVTVSKDFYSTIIQFEEEDY